MSDRSLLKKWLVVPLRRLVGTETILNRLGAYRLVPAAEGSLGEGGSFPATVADGLTAAALERIRGLHEWLADPAMPSGPVRSERGPIPVLADLNGDLVWVPGDLIRHLWPTRSAGEPLFIPHFRLEESHYQWLRQWLRPGDAAIDCGANLGVFTAMMALRVGPRGSVHAFEPSRRVYQDLSRLVELNGFTWVVANRLAVADRCGTAELLEVAADDARREASPLAGLGREAYLADVVHEKVQTPVTTLDRYCEEKSIRPRAMKIDVEGAEFLVLDGAEGCIGECRPHFVLEYHAAPGGPFDHERLRTFLKRHRYRFFLDDKNYYCEPLG